MLNDLIEGLPQSTSVSRSNHRCYNNRFYGYFVQQKDVEVDTI